MTAGVAGDRFSGTTQCPQVLTAVVDMTRAAMRHALADNRTPAASELARVAARSDPNAMTELSRRGLTSALYDASPS